MTDDNISAPYQPGPSTLVVRALRRARQSIFSVASWSGLNGVVSGTRWRDGRLLILCYHGVSLDDEHAWSDLYVSPQLLERRLVWLRQNDFRVLPLDQALEGLYARRLPPRSVVLTFDDGTCDFAVRAMPLLAAHRAPATVYLTTYHVGTQRPVFGSMFSYLLWKGHGRPFTLPGTTQRLVAPGAQETEARDVLQQQVADRAQQLGLSADDKHAWLVVLASELNVDLHALVARRMFHLMSDAELAGLDRSLVDLQLHTHRHITPNDPQLFQREIDDNRAALAPFEGTTPLRHFCYPSGKYTADQLRWLEEAGIVSATTCNPGLAGPRHNPLLLPRLIDTERVSEAKFAAWAHGTGHIVRRVLGRRTTELEAAG